MGLGFRAWGLGFGDWGLKFGMGWGLGIGGLSLAFQVEGVGCTLVELVCRLKINGKGFALTRSPLMAGG